MERETLFSIDPRYSSIGDLYANAEQMFRALTRPENWSIPHRGIPGFPAWQRSTSAPECCKSILLSKSNIL